MKIAKLLEKGRSISFEFFPPKTEEGYKDFFANIKQLKKVEPDFVSVTYGAGGSTKEKTQNIVIKLAHEEDMNVMAHLTCISHTKEEIKTILENYKNNGIDNILALRGDPPNGCSYRVVNELPHASDLIEFIRLNYDHYFSIGGAVFPEKHPDSIDWDSEMKFLKLKVSKGMEFGITQLFFDNKYFYEFLDRCEKTKIYIPIIPGIMPVTNYNQIQKFTQMCKATIPSILARQLEKFKDNPSDIVKIGIEYGIHQCEDLLKNGVKGLHFYTLNKSFSSLLIYREIEKYF
jgi:methylenetetrahydrofolate reductase (NADPH)